MQSILHRQWFLGAAWRLWFYIANFYVMIYSNKKKVLVSSEARPSKNLTFWQSCSLISFVTLVTLVTLLLYLMKVKSKWRHVKPYKRAMASARKGKRITSSQGACNYPIFLSRRFTDRSIFSLNLSRIQIISQTGTSVTNCNHKRGQMLTCRHVYVRPHCFILTEAWSCRLELVYFAGKTSKFRLVCKNAVALA